MSEAPEPQRPSRWRGCLVRALIVVAVLVALFFAIGLAFDQGDDANLPSHSYNAGAAENYERGDVSYVPSEHLYITRLEDGSFIALYDKSPRQQELGSGCRIAFEERAQLGTLEQLPGFEGAFVEECENARSVWRADGTYSLGPGERNLDRFNTHTNDAGELIVDTRTRTCTKSRGVIGVPPYVETTCRGNS
ncbi:MAG TPA: hypothetical protein VFH62_06380 [Dehalococcoidia bacterium]|jgi:hypothetical protein|nr:hypothetical protein [Dehalococcoidia bacterium]